MTTKKYKHRVETIDGVIEWENERPPLPLPPPSTNNNNNRNFLGASLTPIEAQLYLYKDS